MCQNALIKFPHTYSFALLSETKDEKLKIKFKSHKQSTISRLQVSNLGVKFKNWHNSYLSTFNDNLACVCVLSHTVNRSNVKIRL
jgi:hypothetical protein